MSHLVLVRKLDCVENGNKALECRSKLVFRRFQVFIPHVSRLTLEAIIQWNPFIGTTVGTEGNGPIRGVVLLKGWSKMAPRTRWDNATAVIYTYRILVFIIIIGSARPSGVLVKFINIITIITPMFIFKSNCLKQYIQNIL